MKPIKKFSSIKSEEHRILESIKNDYGKMALEVAKKLGYNSLEEIAKEKKILTKLESLLKDLPGTSDVSEDDSEEIEDKVIAKGEPKSLEDKEGEKEEDGEVGGEQEAEVSEDDSEEIEDEILAKGEPKSLEDKEGEKVEEEEDEEEEGESEEEEEGESEEEEEVETEEAETPKATRRIKTFEDFIQEEEETINKNVSYRDDEEEEDYAEPVAASANPMSESEEEEESEEEIEVEETNSYVRSFSSFIKESEKAGSAGKSIPLETGDGSETAAGIAGDTMEMGKPKKEDEKDGEELVTKDQEITEDPETSPGDKGSAKTVVKESRVNEAKLKKVTKQMWAKMDYDQRVNALLTFFKDPDDAEEYGDSDWNNLPSGADGGMYIFESTNDETEIDIDFAGSTSDLKRLSKKYGLEADEYERGKVALKGNKKNILKYLQSPQYDMDIRDIKSLFPELLESVNEAEIKSDKEFEEYAMTVLKKAFGNEFDEAKAQEVIDGLKSKHSGDYGAMVGALQSSLG